MAINYLNDNGIFANTFFDVNDNNFYVDPNGTSVLSVVNTATAIVNTQSNTAVNIRSGGALGLAYVGGSADTTVNSVQANFKISSRYGIGFAQSATGQTVPQWGNAVWIDTTNGNMSARGDITAYASDERLKFNFTPINDPITKIQNISGYKFDWNIDLCKNLGFEPSNETEHGVKAQEIQKVVPDAVEIAPFDSDSDKKSISGKNYLTVKYERLIPLLIEAIKENSKEIEKLKQEIQNLKR